MTGRFLIFLIFLAILFHGSKTCGQVSDQYSLNFYSTAQGLSNNSIICTVQDNYGYIWIGTKDGLNRFDGRNFKIYRNNPGDASTIPNNYILKIFLDKDSGLWIGTRGGGLSRYNRETDSFTSYLYNELDPASLSHPEVLSIFQDHQKTLWIGTDGGGLNKFIPSSGNFKHYKKLLPEKGGLSSLKILSICEYDKDHLLLGTWDGGLNIFDVKTGNSEVIKAEKGKLSSNTIWLTKKEGNSGFWIGHFETGLQFWNKETNHFQTIKFPVLNDISVYSIVNEDLDRLWIGTNSGIYTTRISFHNGNVSYTPLSLFNNVFSLQITVSDNKSLWVANFDNGLMHIHLNDPQFKITEITTARNFSNLFVNAFTELDSENILIGSNQGLFNYNLNTAKLKYLEDSAGNSLYSRRITAFIKDFNNQVYAGKSFSLDKYNPKKQFLQRFYKLPREVSSYDRDGYYDLLRDGNWLWLATENGLFRYNLKTKNTEAIIGNNATYRGYNIYQVRSIVADSTHVFAATLGGGLVVIDKASGDFQIYQKRINDLGSLASNHINQIFISKKGEIWLATFSGLVQFDKKNKQFRHFGIREGFKAEYLIAITEDDHENLWIASQHGISKYNPANFQIQNYFFYNQNEEKSFQVKAAYKSKNGRLYFGRRGGFISFYPDSIKLKSNYPPVLITNVFINNQEVTAADKKILKTNIENTRQIDLAYNQNTFSFTFAAMDFSFAERNKYAYMLEGFDNDWIYTTSPQANYTKVPYGHYKFRVKAANEDGLWNEEGVSISININPAFWQALSFKIIMVCAFLALFFLIYRWRIVKIKRDKLHLQELVNIQTQELSKANSMLEKQFSDLKANKEALQTQRDILEKTNAVLEEKKVEIEEKNRELEQHKENLEELIQERTSELNIAKEKAEQSDRLKSAFLANLSHEIRTPLNAIVGFSSLITNPKLTPEKSDSYNKIIQSSSESLLVLIDDILNLAKIETDQIEISFQEFSLNDLLQELHVLFSQKHQNPDVKLLLAVPKNIVIINSDQIRVRQIIVNFVTNAIKFTNKGYVELGFRIIDASQLDIYVKDTGIGIEEVNFDLIFERFQKLENAGEKFYSGAGLGLAICKRLSKLLHATVWVESTYGKGSTFYLTFTQFFTILG